MIKLCYSGKYTYEEMRRKIRGRGGMYAHLGVSDCRVIEQMINDLVETYEVVKDAEVLMHPAYEPVGSCPCCGASVVEKSKGFFCEDNACKFALWKDNRFFDSLSKKMTKPIAEQLLKAGKVKLKKCKSVKTGKTYDCTVTMNVNENGQAQFGLEFEKNKSKGDR